MSQINTPSLKGFTIVELVIYISFITILSIALVNLVLVGDRQEFANEEKQFLRDAVVELFETLQEDTDNSSAIVSPASGASSATLTLTVSGQSVVYALSSEQITRQVGAGSATPVTPEAVTITDLTFGNYSTSPSPGAFSVAFTANGEPFTASFSRNDE